MGTAVRLLAESSRPPIRVTTEPDDPKDDEVPLMGVACSFFIRQLGDHCVLEYEVFHL